MKSNFEERKANRLERFQELAAKNEQESTAAYETSNRIAEHIPLGQPILIGHHSEKRHRRDVSRIHSAMDKSVQASKKAKYYEGKVESLLSNTAISSDDPNAIDKLQAKVERLEALQELYKDINAAIRKGKNEIEKLDLLVNMGVSSSRAYKYLTPDFAGRIGIPSYMLTNNNANIRTAKARIETLLKNSTIPSSEEDFDGITLKISQEDNRVQIFFPDIPSEEIRNRLNRSGFHWTPSIEAWQRQISPSAIYAAKQILQPSTVAGMLQQDDTTLDEIQKEEIF